MAKKNKGFCWHVHHDTLMEWCRDYKGRLNFIDKNKPCSERELRKRLMQFVKGKLPDELLKAEAACNKAWAAYDKARAAYNKAEAAYNKAEAAYDKAEAAYDKAGAAYNKARAACNKARAACNEAIKKYTKEINKLHTKECPNCPWDGNAIFPRHFPRQ